MSKRTAIITGGMGGLGETISTKMADAGYRVAVTFSPSNKTSDKWLAGMKEQGYDFKAYPCDVTDFESSKACVQKVSADVGPVDILVNNAGITKDMTFRKMGKADWDAVLKTNLNSVFNMTKHVYDGMMDRGWGRIINVSSVNGSKGAFGQTNYAAAKAGHARLHEIAGVGVGEEGRDGQHHLAGIHRHQDGDGNPQGRARQQDPAADPDFPAGQAGRGRRADHLPVFGRGAFVTGANIAINGGQHMQ